MDRTDLARNEFMHPSKASRLRQPSPRLVGGPSTRAASDLARFSLACPQFLAIGTSTGGPQALETMLARLSPHLDAVPVVVVIHMPPAFTEVVAQQIERATGRRTAVARHGEQPMPGQIYFAPGERHLRVVKLAGVVGLCHFDAPPENFCRPSVDVLFRAAAKVFGAGLLGVVLTGMGVDGRNGARAVVENGGSVIVQDEATSVVWGMPGAIAEQGLAAAILPPEDIAATIADLLRGLAPRPRA